MRPVDGVLAMSLVCAALTLAAQDSAKLAKGDAVKVTAPSIQLEHWPGVFVQRRGDSLTVRGTGKDTVLLVLPIGVITHFEVNHGNRKSHGHALTGGLVGLGVGAVVGAAAGCNEGELGCPPRAAAAGIVGLVGGLLGAGIGALIRTSPWKTVALQAQAHAALLPGGRVGVGVSLRL